MATNLTQTKAPETASIAQKVEQVLVKGDLSKLTEQERVFYYDKLCTSVGLNPLTRPLEYLYLNGKLTLYWNKTATDQLRALHDISVVESTAGAYGDIYVVTTKVRNAAGRVDVATGAVAFGNAKGENLANLMMKAETKSKRRATLSICGLGFPDESEVEGIPDADKQIPSRPVTWREHDPETGEIDEIPYHQPGYQYEPPHYPPHSSDVPAAEAADAPRANNQGTPHAAAPVATGLAQYKRKLEEAAESGTRELQQAWLAVPREQRRGAEIEQILRDCQKRAADIDAATRL